VCPDWSRHHAVEHASTVYSWTLVKKTKTMKSQWERPIPTTSPWRQQFRPRRSACQPFEARPGPPKATRIGKVPANSAWPCRTPPRDKTHALCYMRQAHGVSLAPGCHAHSSKGRGGRTRLIYSHEKKVRDESRGTRGFRLPLRMR
jgi:hypothetical protein